MQAWPNPERSGSEAFAMGRLIDTVPAGFTLQRVLRQPSACRIVNGWPGNPAGYKGESGNHHAGPADAAPWTSRRSGLSVVSLDDAAVAALPAIPHGNCLPEASGSRLDLPNAAMDAILVSNSGVAVRPGVGPR